MSKLCPDFVQVLSTSNVDKYWTNFQENTWNHEHSYILDKSWTKIGHGQNIDKIQTNNFVTRSKHFIDKTWTKCGHFFVKFCQIYKNLGQSNSFQTNIGQLTKILDKILTKIRQNLVKLRLF